MITLSFGVKKPNQGDLGDVFFPALEGNIDSFVAHSHDGQNSQKVKLRSIDPEWFLLTMPKETDGVYKIYLPAFVASKMLVFADHTFNQIMLHVESETKNGVTSYFVKTNSPAPLYMGIM